MSEPRRPSDTLRFDAKTEIAKYVARNFAEDESSPRDVREAIFVLLARLDALEMAEEPATSPATPDSKRGTLPPTEAP